MTTTERNTKGGIQRISTAYLPTPTKETTMPTTSLLLCISLLFAGMCGVYATPIEMNLQTPTEEETASAMVMDVKIPINAFLGMRQAIETCRHETNASESDFESLLRRDATPNRAAKCLRACLMKKFDLLSAHGKFNAAVARRIVNEVAADDAKKIHAAEEIIDICVRLAVSNDHCEAAEQYGKCAMHEIQGRGLI